MYNFFSDENGMQEDLSVALVHSIVQSYSLHNHPCQAAGLLDALEVSVQLSALSSSSACKGAIVWVSTSIKMTHS